MSLLPPVSSISKAKAIVKLTAHIACMTHGEVSPGMGRHLWCLDKSFFFIDEKFNPNGALKNIAGIFNKKKNILGMMPHPERMIDKYLSSNDGNFFFENLYKNLK